MKNLLPWYYTSSLTSLCALLLNIEVPYFFSFVLFLKILQTLTEESNPSANLVVAVKHLYETKLKVCLPFACILYYPNSRLCPFSRLLLSAFAESCNYLWQDASILIPFLSSFPKEEVLVSPSVYIMVV